MLWASEMDSYRCNEDVGKCASNASLKASTGASHCVQAMTFLSQAGELLQ